MSFIYRIDEDTGRTEKAVGSPVLFFVSASPDGTWLIARVAGGANGSTHTNVAFPTVGGPPRSVCDACEIDWTPSGKSLVVRFAAEHSAGRTYVIALTSPGTLPPLPNGGIHAQSDLARFVVSQTLDGYVYPSSDEQPRYAFRRGTVRRNIYRVPLP